MKKNKKNLKNKSVKNYKNSVLRRNIITLSSSFVLMIVALIATILVLNKHIDEKKFMAYEGYYSSDQTVIDGTGAPAQQYIKMSEFYTISNNTVSPTSTTPGTKYITIETKADLYAFSKLCNSTSRFTGYNYKLLKDIDWDLDDTTVFYFDPVNSFSGTFDGNGYTIKNLGMATIASGTRTTDYAMFVTLTASGTIKNLGLINPILTINVSPVSGSAVYVANLCGTNKGTIDYVFVRDSIVKAEEREQAGISVTAPNYRVSGIVGKNDAGASLTNAYYAGTKVFNTTTYGSPEAFQEILVDNYGTVENLFFYDELIESVVGTMDSDSNNTVSIHVST